MINTYHVNSLIIVIYFLPFDSLNVPRNLYQNLYLACNVHPDLRILFMVLTGARYIPEYNAHLGWMKPPRVNHSTRKQIFSSTSLIIAAVFFLKSTCLEQNFETLGRFQL